MTDRSEERRELFVKQLERAEQDVRAWPDYVKQALIKPLTGPHSHPPNHARTPIENASPHGR